jgi:hypothetical protein
MLTNTKPNLNNLYLFPQLIHSFLHMKKFLFAFFLIALFASCEKDSTRRTNNPYLPNYGFSTILNLNLPSNSQLLNNFNPMPVNVDGDIYILIMKTADNYVAWNGNCPNHTQTACSRLTIVGSDAKCNCDDGFIYSLFSGLGENATYPLINYRVESLGNNTIRVYN